MAFRKDLLALLSAGPRSVSSLARELGLGRGDVEEDLQHALRSARAPGGYLQATTRQRAAWTGKILSRSKVDCAGYARIVETIFRAVISKDGVNPFVDVPARVSRAFAAFVERGRIRVAGTIEGHALHATLVPTKAGTHRLYVNGGMRASAGVDVGDRVTLKLRALQVDEVDLPADLAKALTRSSLRQRFDALSASHRRELLRSIEDARSSTNRTARIERTLSHVRGESTQRPKATVIDKPVWIFPKCGHSFVTRNMNHSCARHELDEVFRGKPAHIRQLFDRFRTMVDERGPTTMIVYRDRAAFMVKVRFGGATPKRDHLELGFWFTERDEDPRFSKIETIATNTHVHRTRIRALDELDKRVRQWIDRAYRVGCRDHLR